MSHRSHAIDGVRGLAAASVVVMHLMSVFVDTSMPSYARFDHLFKLASYTPLSLPWAGYSAVIVFFLLSGYALHRMLSAPGMTYGGYVVRRVIRLWIPYAMAVVLAACSIALIGSHKIPEQSIWLNTFLGSIFSWRSLLQHASMIGVYDTRPFDFVIWTLVIEMRISLVFPVIYWTVNRYRAGAVLISSLAIGAAAYYCQRRGNAYIGAVMSTLVNHTCFVIGALLSRHETRLRHWYAKIPRNAKIAVAAVAVILYCDCFKILTLYRVMCAATWLLVMTLCSGRVQGALAKAPVQWLGRISYSLYICHAVVILTLINALYPRFSFPSIVLGCIPTILAVSYVFYWFVERPSIRWSRAAGRRMRVYMSAEGT